MVREDADPIPIPPADHAETIMLDLVQPLWPGRDLAGDCRQAGCDEADRQYSAGCGGSGQHRSLNTGLRYRTPVAAARYSVPLSTRITLWHDPSGLGQFGRRFLDRLGQPHQQSGGVCEPSISVCPHLVRR